MKFIIFITPFTMAGLIGWQVAQYESDQNKIQDNKKLLQELIHLKHLEFQDMHGPNGLAQISKTDACPKVWEHIEKKHRHPGFKCGKK